MHWNLSKGILWRCSVFAPLRKGEAMGEPNNALKAYMKRPERVRSVLEYYLGERLPEDWKCSQTDAFLPMQNVAGKLTFRERDYLGEVNAWGVRFLVGIENQQTINLTYPWRLMEMDCLTYGREIEAIQERNREGGVRYGQEDDFKYRYRKEDVLMPVVSLMLYWGRKEWKGPRSLRGMMGDMSGLPRRLRRLVGNYHTVMIPMRSIPDEDLGRMDSDLKYVLGILKCTASRKQFERYILKNREYFSRIPKSAVDVIDVFTNIRDIRNRLEYAENQDNGEEEADMCKALEDIKRHELDKGVKEGLKQGRKEGRKQGVKQGVKQGERLGTLKTLCALVNDGLLKADEAARRANLSKKAFGMEMKKAGYR